MQNDSEKKPLKVLFLDRDGVINRCIVGEYVRRKEDFEFLPGSLSALSKLARKFDWIVVVTNQQGVGKGLMSRADLEGIHAYMLRRVAAAGGRIDAVYYCPHLTSEGCACRKPRNGMLLQAAADLPQDIDWQQSVLLGDSLTDLQAAGSLGLRSVWVRPPNPTDELRTQADLWADEQCDSLWDWTEKL